ncbi:MAG: tail fiber protein [Cyclobacteriaceae bacterium]
MKKERFLLSTLAILLIATFSVVAQNEQKSFSFQGYARDFSGAAYSSETITAQFSIYPEGESVEYTEQQTLETDAYGVFHAMIGSVVPVNFEAIDFSSKKYFMKVEVKAAGGDFVEISNTELLAVPYAKAAENAVNANSARSADNGNPPGTILPFGGPLGKIPAGYLACDGTSVAVADYPELYAAVEDSWGGDGGTNFYLPDFRGRFMRGFDNGAGNDPNSGSRSALQTGGNTGDAVGSYQSDEFKSHNHDVEQIFDCTDCNRLRYQIDNNDGGGRTVQSGVRGGSETRPKNATVLFMIKY